MRGLMPHTVSLIASFMLMHLQLLLSLGRANFILIKNNERESGVMGNWRAEIELLKKRGNLSPSSY